MTTFQVAFLAEMPVIWAWTSDGEFGHLSAIPTGLRPSALGCRTRLPWDDGSRWVPTPTGLRHQPATSAHRRYPWVAEYGNPGRRITIGANPNGVAPLGTQE